MVLSIGQPLLFFTPYSLSIINYNIPITLLLLVYFEHYTLVKPLTIIIRGSLDTKTKGDLNNLNHLSLQYALLCEKVKTRYVL